MDQKQIEEIRNRKRIRQKRKKRLQIATGLLIFAGSILVIGFLFWGRHGPWKDDPNATTQKPLTKAEQQAELQKAADESRFRFKMNTAPTVTWIAEPESEAESENSGETEAGSESESMEEPGSMEESSADTGGENSQENATETQPEHDTADHMVQVADWYIVNSMENPWDMEVVITSTQDGSQLYRSARLKPGEREMSGPLETTLEPGTYGAVATATAINPETGETVGTVSADLTLTVEAKQQN